MEITDKDSLFLPKFPSIMTRSDQNNFQGCSRKEKIKRRRRMGFSSRPIEDERGNYFNEIYKADKNKKLTSLFIKKLRQVIVNRQCPNIDQISLNGKQKMEENDIMAPKIPKLFQIIVNILIIMQVLILLISSTIALTFKEVNTSTTLKDIQIVCFIIQILQMFTKLIFKSSLKMESSNEESKNLSHHILKYLKSQFFIDLLILVILIVDQMSLLTEVPYLRLIIIIKIKSTLEKVNILEIGLIQNYYNEQYWELAKVFLFNFIFAHFVCLILLLMAQLQPTDNWLINKNLNQHLWFQKYIWSYYWAINIMFTVGFGDLVATTTVEAGCMIFVQVMSCIILTYNINSVGNIIRMIRSYDEDKEKNIRTFTRMQEKSEVSDELKNKMTNFINESVDMRRKYDIEEQDNLLTHFPQSILEEYKKETNIKIFKNIPFFKHISLKYLQEIALLIERKLTHPQEIILSFKKIPNIVIASGGQVSLVANSVGYRIHGKEMQSIKVKKSDYKLLSLNFLFNKEMKYDIKCKDYCVIYTIKKSEICNIIQSNPYNYQFYCMTKDKYLFDPDQFETFQCNICGGNEKHSVFQCPKLHFIPFKQHVIAKHNSTSETKQILNFPKKQIRKNFIKPKCHPLLQYFQWNKIISQEDLDDVFDQKIAKKPIQKFMKKTNGHQIKQNLLPIRTNSNRKRQSTMLKGFAKELKEQITKVQMLISDKKFFQWPIECDLAFDFQYYFHDFNPSSIGKTFDFKKRIQRKHILPALIN